MFRDLQRRNQALSHEECIALLDHELRGVLSVLGDDNYPYGTPINHYYCHEDGKTYFHGGRHGHKIDAIKCHNKVSFYTFDKSYKNEGEWALNIKSVIVFGKIECIKDQEIINEISAKLSRKFTDDEVYIANEIADYGSATLLLALTPEHISGKLVKES